MKRLAAALAAVLVLVGCSSVKTGTVTEKKWWDEYVTIMPIYTYDAKGQITGMYVQEVYTPPCWEIYLKNGDDAGSLCIDPNEWMRYEVGQSYP